MRQILAAAGVDPAHGVSAVHAWRSARRSRPTRCSSGAARACCWSRTSGLVGRLHDRHAGAAGSLRAAHREAGAAARARDRSRRTRRRGRRGPRGPRRRRARARARRRARGGLDAVAAVSIHAHAHPGDEARWAALARAAGFPHAVASHEIARELGLLARGETAIADAYLTPLLQRHVRRARGGAAGRARALHAVVGRAHRRRALPRAGRAALGSRRRRGRRGARRERGRRAPGDRLRHGRHLDRRVAAARRRGRPRLRDGGRRRARARADAAHPHRRGGRRLAVSLRRLPHDRRARRAPAPIRARSATTAATRDGRPLARELTLTDVNHFLGRLPPERFPFPLVREPVERALEALREALAREGHALELDAVAAGFVAVANASMAQAIERVSVARGVDPRECALVGFGGAAGQHVCQVARALGIRRVLLHPLAGLLSALGIGSADPSVDAQRDAGRVPLAAGRAPDSVAALFRELEAGARAALAREGEAAETAALRALARPALRRHRERGRRRRAGRRGLGARLRDGPPRALRLRPAGSRDRGPDGAGPRHGAQQRRRRLRSRRSAPRTASRARPGARRERVVSGRSVASTRRCSIARASRRAVDRRSGASSSRPPARSSSIPASSRALGASGILEIEDRAGAAAAPAWDLGPRRSDPPRGARLALHVDRRADGRRAPQHRGVGEHQGAARLLLRRLRRRRRAGRERAAHPRASRRDGGDGARAARSRCRSSRRATRSSPTIPSRAARTCPT